MARGRPRKNVQEMNEKELDDIEKNVNVESQEMNNDVQKMNNDVQKMNNVDNKEENFKFSKKLSHIDIDKKQPLFPKKNIDVVGWIPMTDDEAIEYQRKGILIGHNSIKQIGLIKKKKISEGE